ncbi:MAG: 2-oxoacid:acceptor oxidoreductase subunit alpha [Planctomycetota bacterium]|jgi:2-oxoglutarate ferredoxin oxidoreductase subunit alpha
MTEPITNDFSIRIATPNGTGSQTSNLIIFRSLFHMGLAPSAKNLFPSNIAGLPTWYQIRVSPEGWQARREDWQILLPLNPQTIAQDLRECAPGTVVIDNGDMKGVDESLFEGLERLSVPFDQIARKEIADAKLRPKLKNLIYVGVVAERIGIPEESLRAAIDSIFGRKPAVAQMNFEAAQLGVSYAREHFTAPSPYRVAPARQTEGKILIEGNDAAAIGCVFGGVSVVAWYPITPASSLAENLITHVDRLREKDEEGRNRFIILQAEDELAAIGMALGAGWAGARSMTSTSGPGISLMSENLGLGYFAELPTVVFDVQRVGPSTGLPTRTQQSDLLLVAFQGHGDTRFPMLLPGNPKEAFEDSCLAFDLAERFQMPFFVLSDLDLGMNLWVSDELEYPEAPFDRGKIATDEVLARLDDWGRYLDVDGDGVPYRTIPQKTTDPRTAHLTRGSGHDEYGRYSEDPEVYTRNLDRLARKVDGTVERTPAPIVQPGEGEVGIIAFGTTDYAVTEALAGLESPLPYLRVRAWPFHPEVGAFLRAHEKVVVVEQNQQGQLAQLLQIAFPELAPRIESALYYGGLPLSAEFVRGAIEEHTKVEA